MQPPTSPPDRQRFRAIVADVAARAKERLPQEVNGRVESAVKLVLQGDVFFLDDGTVHVGSSDPLRYYRLTGQACTCTDFTQGKAPSGWCKHRIAAGIQKRVKALLPASAVPDGTGAVPAHPTPPAGELAPVGTLPEAPASLNFRAMIGGYETQITLRDVDESALLARMQALLKRPDLKPVPKPAPRQGQWRKGGRP